MGLSQSHKGKRLALGDRPALSREYILHTALRIVDRDGPDKLTMRRLGAELGVDPMAVYHYLPNKAALFRYGVYS